MKSCKRPLILPVENQVREFDAKLLLACVAAERGMPGYIGAKNVVLNKIAKLPVGVFLAKELRTRKGWMNKILISLGHKIIAWDEEGMVPHPPKIYYKNRISSDTIAPISAIFAWGNTNAQLIKNFPGYDQTPVYETGNPRADLLRSDVREYFHDEVRQLKETYGNFILINSNFGRNNYILANSKSDHGGAGSQARLQDKDWDEMHQYRDRLFKEFMAMVDRLPADFPDVKIVMRPHPSENIETWKKYEARHKNLHVIFQGNVIPWLMAADVLVHNGCTTAIEAVLLDKPIVAYQPITSEEHDRHLPNSVSKPVASYDELVAQIHQYLDHGEEAEALELRKSKLDPELSRDEARLASDIILDRIEALFPDLDSETYNIPRHAAGRVAAFFRSKKKWLRAKLPNDVNTPRYQQHVFPDLTAADVDDRISRFKHILNRFEDVSVSEIDQNLFLISKNSAGQS